MDGLIGITLQASKLQMASLNAIIVVSLQASCSICEMIRAEDCGQNISFTKLESLLESFSSRNSIVSVFLTAFKGSTTDLES